MLRFLMTKTILLGATLAAVFVFAMITNSVFASEDPKKVSASVSGGIITITAEGDIDTVGTQSPKLISAYVVATDVGLFAITAHFGVDDDDATGDHDWHSHGFTLDSDFCIATIDSDGTVTSAKGNTITVAGTGATVINGAFFALLKINNDGSICVHKIF